MSSGPTAGLHHSREPGPGFLKPSSLLMPRRWDTWNSRRRYLLGFVCLRGICFPDFLLSLSICSWLSGACTWWIMLNKNTNRSPRCLFTVCSHTFALKRIYLWSPATAQLTYDWCTCLFLWFCVCWISRETHQESKGRSKKQGTAVLSW